MTYYILVSHQNARVFSDKSEMENRARTMAATGGHNPEQFRRFEFESSSETKLDDDCALLAEKKVKVTAVLDDC